MFEKIGGTASAASAEAMAQAPSGERRLVELRGAHHLLHHRRPAEVAELIVDAAGQ